MYLIYIVYNIYIFRLQDLVDPVVDEQLALFVVNSHMRSHPNNTSHTISEQDNNAEEDIKDENDENEKTKANLDTIIVNQSDVYKNTKDLNQPKPIDQDILKKYITYARAYIKPVLHDVDSEKVIKLFFFP